MDEQGIRGGSLWRRIIDFPLVAMLSAAALYIAALTIGFLLMKIAPPMDRTAKLAADAALSIALVLAAYKLVIVKLGEHPRDDLRPDGALRDLGLGLLIGFVVFSAVVGVAAIFDIYDIYGIGDASNFVIALISTAIMPAFMEELFFRGIVFRWIEEFGGTWTGLALSSALFGAAHLANPGATWVAAAWIAFEAGILLGAAYMLTRNLWMPMGLHAAWNFTQGEIFDVPVSGLDAHGLVRAKLAGPEILTGGAFGLESSVIALVIATVAGVWLVVLAVRRGELMKPWWVRRRSVSSNPAVVQTVV